MPVSASYLLLEDENMKYILLFAFPVLWSCTQMLPAVSKKISPGVYQISVHGSKGSGLEL